MRLHSKSNFSPIQITPFYLDLDPTGSSTSHRDRIDY